MTKKELVNFLLTVDKKHIEELVDILTDFGKGRVALNATVKEVLWQIGTVLKSILAQK